jgi:hypothetical protein
MYIWAQSLVLVAADARVLSQLRKRHLLALVQIHGEILGEI